MTASGRTEPVLGRSCVRLPSALVARRVARQSDRCSVAASRVRPVPAGERALLSCRWPARCCDQRSRVPFRGAVRCSPAEVAPTAMPTSTQSASEGRAPDEVTRLYRVDNPRPGQGRRAEIYATACADRPSDRRTSRRTAHAVDLHDGFTVCRCVVRHSGREVNKAPRRQWR